MFNYKKEVEKNLPEGTLFQPQNYTYRYKAFTMDCRFFLRNPRFNWIEYINNSFSRCLESTCERFLKVD
jgi:hypothetical protein